MKKMILMFAVCLFAAAGNVSAQVGTGQGTGKVSLQDFHFMKAGLNKLSSANGNETIHIVKKRETISEVLFIDVTGKSTKLFPAQAVIPGAPKTDCDSRIPVQFFNSAAGNIGFFICTSGATAGSPEKFYKLDVLSTVHGATGKAQNRRVEVKLSK